MNILPSPPKTKRRWWTVFALSAAAFVDSAENYSLSVLWPKMFASLGALKGDLGMVLGINGFIGVITTPLWGAAADRFSRKKLLILLTGMWGLWTMAVGFVQDLNGLLFVRILSSLGLGILWPAAFSLLADLFTTRERGRAAGVMTAVSFFGTIASFGVLPMLAEMDPEGWRWGFIGMGIFSALTGLFMLVINDPPRGSAEAELVGVSEAAAEKYAFRIANLPHIVRVRSWWVMLVHTSLDAVALAILYGWAFTWIDELKMGDSAFMIFGLLAFGNILGHLFFGWLGDVLDRRHPRYGRAGMAMAGLGVSVPALAVFIGLGGEGGLAVLIPFGLISGIALSSVDTGARWPLTQAVLRPELRATGRAALDMVVGVVGAATMTLSSALVNQFGVTTMLLLLIPIPKLLGALTWVPIFFTYPKDRAALQATLQERRSSLL